MPDLECLDCRARITAVTTQVRPPLFQRSCAPASASCHDSWRIGSRTHTLVLSLRLAGAAPGAAAVEGHLRAAACCDL